MTDQAALGGVQRQPAEALQDAGEKRTADPASFGNIDLLVEAIEDRVLEQIERRGGRYQGEF